jgi:cysteine desulfurase/selenocysteine lyase
MELDVGALRGDTPGCDGKLIHLNNAGAALMPRPVITAVTSHIARESRVGGYEAATEAADEVEAFYAKAAALVGGKPDEIAFVDNATRAWQGAFYAIDWKPGDQVLTARSEYNSHMIAFRHAERRFGIEPILVPDTAEGTVDVDALERLITSRTRLICVSHMPTNDGMINPAVEVGQVARRHGLPFLLDACQSAGQMPIDVAELGCTMLSTTGRKYLRGPRGTGFLWVQSDWLTKLSPMTLDIGSARWTSIAEFDALSDARKFEHWEANIAGKIGLMTACGYAMATGIPAIWRRVQMLSTRLREIIAEIPGFSVHDRGARKGGIVTFSHKAVSSERIMTALREEFSINTSVSATQLTRTDLIDRGVAQMVRASVHAYNSEEDLDRFAAALIALGKAA